MRAVNVKYINTCRSPLKSWKHQKIEEKSRKCQNSLCVVFGDRVRTTCDPINFNFQTILASKKNWSITTTTTPAENDVQFETNIHKWIIVLKWWKIVLSTVFVSLVGKWQHINKLRVVLLHSRKKNSKKKKQRTFTLRWNRFWIGVYCLFARLLGHFLAFGYKLNGSHQALIT